MKPPVIVGIVAAVLIILGIGAFVVTNDNNDTNNQESTSQTPETTTPDTDTDTEEPDAAVTTMAYTDSGFNPTTINVKAGTVVTIKNDATVPLQFQSDPHPEHTANPELNVGLIAPGTSKTVTPAQVGTWGVHNHLNPNDKATIIVQP